MNQVLKYIIVCTNTIHDSYLSVHPTLRLKTESLTIIISLFVRFIYTTEKWKGFLLYPPKDVSSVTNPLWKHLLELELELQFSIRSHDVYRLPHFVVPYLLRSWVYRSTNHIHTLLTHVPQSHFPELWKFFYLKIRLKCF